ncbi:MAG: response regulator transcription factor [Deltaproteobacteria bacterium]|nr:response regulator transcription factor [Deltaproteobacteria bacterium]
MTNASLPVPFALLTRRQLCVVAERFVQGRTVEKTARVLHISPAGVKKHTQRIYEKVGVTRLVQLVHALHTSGAYVALLAMASRGLLRGFRRKPPRMEGRGEAEGRKHRG